MDNSKSRKSDAAATRKRRSSILKSQRAPRAPFSELEFNVATPQDTAKSRRVSFSRRTGVAEFEINEATTAWKNVYEEHNKSLETSGNESGARPRRVQHLGGRSADLFQFQDAEAELVGSDMEVAAPRAALELSQLTEQRTADVFRLTVTTLARDPSGRLDLDFSSVAPLDDLDALQRDLDTDTERRADMSEYNIDVDFNATHFTLKGDDSDDMSITDSIHSPRVAAAADERPPDWAADKENIVVNPYVAPPPADFADDECDDILVFDGKKCKFQSKLSDDESVKPSDASHRKTIVYEAAGEVSVAPAAAGRAAASDTVFFDDVADMTVTQAVPAQILPQKLDLGLVSGDDEYEECILAGREPRRQTIVYGNEEADVSVTLALPANIIGPIQIACDDSNVDLERPESKTEKQKTMYFDDMADISVTQALPANIIQREPEGNERDVSVKQTAPLSGPADGARTLLGDAARPHTDRRRTIVYGNDDGDLSVTGALPGNILDKEAKPNQENTGYRTTIVYQNADYDIPIMGVVMADVMDRDGVRPAQPENARRRTIVYDNDDGNISMTGVVPANVMVNQDESKLVQPLSTDLRKTIIYGNDDGNVSVTGVVPTNVMVICDEDKPVQSVNSELTKTVLFENVSQPATDRRRTIVFGNDDANISVTGIVPANIMVERESILPQTSSTDRRKTIVYGNDDGNISTTGVVPVNIMIEGNDAKLALPTTTSTTERRKTVVFENDDGNTSVTGVVPTNIKADEEIENPAIHTATERRNTVVAGNDDGNVTETGGVPADIIVGGVIKSLEEIKSADRRKTIVYGNDDGNISVTGVVPANIIVEKLPESSSNERRKTIVYGNDDGEISMTGVVPANIMVDKNEINHIQPTNTERRRTVIYENDDGDVSTTGVVPAHIVAEELEDGAELIQPATTERRRTVVYGNEDGDVSMTGVVPADIIVVDRLNHSQRTNAERRKTVADDGNMSMTGVVKAEHLTVEGQGNKADLTQPTIERRKTIDYGNDDSNLSMTGVVPANVTMDIGGANETRPVHTERRKTIVSEYEGDDISTTGVVPADVIEKSDIATDTERRETGAHENDGNISTSGASRASIRAAEENGADAVEIITETIDYRDEEGDVSMTEVEPDANSAPHARAQPTESEDIISEDKNDQVSMSSVSRTPSLRSPGELSAHTSDDISVQTSAVRRAPAGGAGADPSRSGRVSAVHTSPGDVLAYGACARGGRRGAQPHAHSSKSDDFEAICATKIDEFSRSLAADRSLTIDARSQSSPDSASKLDPLSRTRPDRTSALDASSRGSEPDRMALDVLSRSLAPDRALILDALSPEAALERAALACRSPPTSVLDALLDMSSMDDELVTGPSEAAARAAPGRGLGRDSDDDATDADDEAMPTSESTTPTEYDENRGVGDSGRPAGERRDRAVDCEEPHKTDARVETEDVERDEENQTQWASSCAGTQADDTRALLDALDRCTDARSADRAPPRRSLAPDRRSMVRSREDLLKDISMAQALMRTEMEQSDSAELEEPEPEPEPGPPRAARFSGEVVKTLCFDDDSVRESPRVLRKPAPVEAESRRAALIPPYLQHVGEIKDLMDDLVKPTADAAPRRPRSAARHSEIQTDSLPSSQIDLAAGAGAAAYRAAGAACPLAASRTDRDRPDEASPLAASRTDRARPDEADAAPRARTLSPLVRLPAESEVLVFDRHNPLNNVALPSAARAPHAYRPAACLSACPSACPSLEPRATQTEAPAPRQLLDRGRRLLRDATVEATSRQSCASRCDGSVSPAVSHAAVDARVSPAVFAAHALKHECASPGDAPMEDDIPVVKHRSPQRVAFKLDESSAGSGEEDEGAEHSEGAEPGERKRGYSPADARFHELTPKPALKVQKISTASKVPRRSASPAARASLSRAGPEPRGRAGSDVTVQQLLSEFHLSDTSGWAGQALQPPPASLHAARSAEDVHDAAGADVINRIAVLPFMGTECSWESVSGDTWSFRLLRARLRLVVRLEHRVQRARAHTAVVLAVVQHAVPQHDECDPVALWCVRLAAEALQQQAQNARRAGAVPALLRRGVALCRCALRWARALHHARRQLAFSLDDSGELQLKVANIPLRSVWEVSLRVELECGAAGAWPRARDVRVARVVASWAPAPHELEALLAPLPHDWGHVPRAVWKIFKYLKYKRLEDDDVPLGA